MKPQFLLKMAPAFTAFKTKLKAKLCWRIAILSASFRVESGFREPDNLFYYCSL
jgi:hypothetical protein